MHFPADKSGTAYKTFLYKNLGTSDPIEAAKAAQEFVKQKRRIFLRKAGGDRSSQGLLSEARRWRSNIRPEDNRSIQQGEPASGPAICAEQLEELGLEQEYTEGDALVDRAYDLEAASGTARAMRFFNLSSGRTTPIADTLDEWLRSETYAVATCNRYRRTVKELIDWCRSSRIPADMEEIDDHRAARFLSRSNDRNSKTIANEKATLSSLWEWFNSQLMARLVADANGLNEWIGDHGDNPWRKGGAHVSSDVNKPSEK